MPQYKDEARGTWYCKFSYQDWTGQRRQKLKRGFSTKREAAAWERDFLDKQQGNPGMTLQALHDLYMEDMNHRVRPATMQVKRNVFKNHVLPYLGEKPINQITPLDVRKWQNTITGSGLSEGYKRIINAQLRAIFRYAVQYCGLKSNPCNGTGPIGSLKRSGPIQFWTQAQFKAFVQAVPKLSEKVAFYVLFYTGIRKGELLALEASDVDLTAGTITISKTHHGTVKSGHTAPPKTENSNRTVTLPDFLTEMLRDYMRRIYGLGPHDQLFPFAPATLGDVIKRLCPGLGLPVIRVHDLRHSHVSMLIDMGCSSHLIAERIGDTVQMVNMTYGHLYPSRKKDVADKLNQIANP